MNENDSRKLRERWNRLADEWRIQVGDEGDRNRVLNSDPLLWAFAGEVVGRDVLDAGCGTGYLAKMLRDRGARVVGVDFSERMIAIARELYRGIDFRADDCAVLGTIPDGSIDLVIANYVLQDVADLEGVMCAFHRVLRDGGATVLVFSHPCFPQGSATRGPGDATTYRWDHPYFERRRRIDPPWAHFTTDFVWFHRPLSDYWNAFVAAGFTVTDFEEPRLGPDRAVLARNKDEARRHRTRPYSVIFALRKTAWVQPTGRASLQVEGR